MSSIIEVESYIWALIKDNHSNEYIWTLINLNPLSRKALDCLFGWHIKFIKLRNKGCLGKITEFTLMLNIENERLKILRWENSYFDHFGNEETINYTVAIWRSCHHNCFSCFSFFSAFYIGKFKALIPSVMEFIHFHNFLNPDVQFCRTSLI